MASTWAGDPVAEEASEAPLAPEAATEEEEGASSFTAEPLREDSTDVSPATAEQAGAMASPLAPVSGHQVSTARGVDTRHPQGSPKQKRCVGCACWELPAALHFHPPQAHGLTSHHLLCPCSPHAGCCPARRPSAVLLLHQRYASRRASNIPDTSAVPGSVGRACSAQRAAPRTRLVGPRAGGLAGPEPHLPGEMPWWGDKAGACPAPAQALTYTSRFPTGILDLAQSPPRQPRPSRLRRALRALRRAFRCSCIAGQRE